MTSASSDPSVPHLSFHLVDYEPISVNHAYVPAGRGRFWVRKEVGVYKEAFKSSFFWPDSVALPNTMMVTYLYLLPKEVMYYKNGRLRKRDVSNYVKILEDALMEVLRNDDSYVLSMTAHKRVSPDGRYHCICVVTSCSMEDPVYHGPYPLAALVDEKGVTTHLLRPAAC